MFRYIIEGETRKEEVVISFEEYFKNLGWNKVVFSDINNSNSFKTESNLQFDSSSLGKSSI